MNKATLQARQRTAQVGTVRVKAPLMGPGYLDFYKLRTNGWVCGDCLEKVRPSDFEVHTRKEHGFR